MQLRGACQVPYLSFKWVSLSVFVSILLAGMYGCDSGPTKPDQPIKYYAFFGKGGGGANILKYDFESKELDSAYVPINLGDPITPSADGSLLYCPGYFEHGADIVDTRSWEVIGQLPVIGSVVTSPDGRYLAVHGVEPEGGFYILDARDYTILFQDALLVNRGVFNRSGNIYYASVRIDTCAELYRLDLRRPFRVERKCIANWNVREDPLLSPDETKLYFYNWYHTFISAIEEYDLLLGSVTYTEYLVPGGGNFSMHPDGRIAFTNAKSGVMPDGPPPPYAWANLDIQTKSIDTTLVVRHACDTFANYLNEVAYAPDGRWMIGSIQGPGRLLVFDRSLDSIVQAICFAANAGISNLVINKNSHDGR